MTSSPSANPVTSVPACATIPARSLPCPDGNVAGHRECSRPSRILASPGLMPAALTRTSTCAGPGCGTGTSTTLRTSTPPYSSNRTAFGMAPSVLSDWPRISGKNCRTLLTDRPIAGIPKPHRHGIYPALAARQRLSPVPPRGRSGDPDGDRAEPVHLGAEALSRGYVQGRVQGAGHDELASPQRLAQAGQRPGQPGGCL